MTNRWQTYNPPKIVEQRGVTVHCRIGRVEAGWCLGTWGNRQPPGSAWTINQCGPFQRAMAISPQSKSPYPWLYHPCQTLSRMVTRVHIWGSLKGVVATNDRRWDFYSDVSLYNKVVLWQYLQTTEVLVMPSLSSTTFSIGVANKENCYY